MNNNKFLVVVVVVAGISSRFFSCFLYKKYKNRGHFFN